jgi:hypothetical protein
MVGFDGGVAMLCMWLGEPAAAVQPPPEPVQNPRLKKYVIPNEGEARGGICLSPLMSPQRRNGTREESQLEQVGLKPAEWQPDTSHQASPGSLADGFERADLMPTCSALRVKVNLSPRTGRQEAQGQAACFSFLA